MFDTMTLTKIVGGVCGALLIYLMGHWVAETMYSMGGGHGDDHHQAYVIDTGEDSHGGDEAEEGPSLAELYAAADVEKGEKIFKKCAACHATDDSTVKSGPPLSGVVGREIGSFGDFGYSGALNALGESWTPDALFAFLESPKNTAPGTTMTFKGLSKPEERANVIMYLDQLDGDITEMAAPAEEASVQEAVEEVTEEAAAAVEEATEEVAEAAEEAIEEVAEAAEEAVEEMTEAAEEATEAATEEVAAVAEQVTEEVAAVVEEATEAASEAVEEAAEEATAAAGASEFAALVAAADAEAGKKVFKRCMACHKLEDGARGAGPHLYQIVGRTVASADGFKYSNAMKEMGGEWTLDRLNDWIADPKGFLPGNKMRFKGLDDIQDRANVVAYLQSAGN